MISTSLRMTAKIYRCLSENQERPLPFEELCTILYPVIRKVDDSSDLLSAENEYKTKVMMSLIFLSDLQLINLNQITDESFINLSNRN
ncbi:hypothetical protein [Flavobacterium fluviatile]|uniref:hypothetical protein n=1 Tax=Flavobacterium fluviatile TaxID=1862387 RepID=UPI0013D6C17C|nr:hypothetical protein [Flavobacterium fluviatile]